MVNGTAASSARPESLLSLRAIQETDLPLLRRIYASTREQELEVVPWSAEQKQAFLLMQFEAQHKHYQTYYGDGSFDLILLSDEPIGRLYVGRWPSEICVIDISLLPPWRSQGIGGTLLNKIIHEADQLAKQVSVHVEKHNPARRLYERLGFIKVKDLEVYDQMIRPPPSGTGD